MFKPALLLMLVLTTAQADSPVPDRYVPATGWRGSEARAAGLEAWYGQQLRAMNERPITAAASDGLRRRFRLLVLPNYQPAFAYRIDVEEQGGAQLRWARLDGAGGYAPGNIAQQGSRVMRPRELRHFMAAMDEAALGTRDRELEPPVRTESDGTQAITICLHATHYVFEDLGEQGHTFVVRQGCYMEKPLRRLVQTVFRLRPLAPSRW